MADDLAGFLRSHLDEVAAAAQMVSLNPGEAGSPVWVVDDDYQHDTLAADPAWVLADVEAKRRVIDLHETRFGNDPAAAYQECLRDGEPYPCLTLRLMAAPLVDRPGYQPEWAPAPVYDGPAAPLWDGTQAQ